MPRIAHPTRREDILSAAREEFIANGFAAARMEDIGRRAGISKATVYLQFSSKEAVFRALMSEIIAENLPKLTPTDFGDTPAPQLLRLFITAAFHIITNRDIAFVPRLIVGEGQNFPELTRFYHDEAITRLLGVIQSILHHGAARGEFAGGTSLDTCRSIAGGIVLAALWRVVFEPVGAESIVIADAAQAHADMVLNGLCIRQES